ncbi:hypothetical protein [Photobacterium damselae]|uniref:hypothetical protein n=1 Tax=Photobacterium damselae TaxID=38293 RepID=UPI001EFE4FC1|nr:hypothetical protein [Photobacterium damselae]MCG9778353.1 hypothetical protein [Photobacterium damselae]
MSYGYRLNVEQLLLKNANRSWLEADKNLVSVRHSDPVTAKDIMLMSPAFDDEKTISLCIESVLGWAIATEAFVNLAWQNTPNTSGLEEKLFKSTVDKIKYLCKTNEINYGSLKWRDDLVDLFKLRDYLVHYKDPITYIGFSFAPKYQRDFCQKNMARYQLSVMSLMEVLGGKLGMDISFLTGEFELFYYSE